MSFKRILALTDLSENSHAGLALAERLSHRFHARVVVGYIHTRSDVLREFSTGDENRKRLEEWVRRDDEEHLQELCGRFIERLRMDGIESVEAPNARAGLPHLIERASPDLVCMATRGRSGVPHLLLGSVAEHTIRTAGVPVIVARDGSFPPPDAPLKVLVGLDLIEEPTYLARKTASFLTTDDELVLGHVVESWYYSPAAYGSEYSLPQPDVPALIGAATTRLSQINLGEDAPKLTVEVTSGRPRDGLLGLAERASPHIVVTRTHGRRGFDRMMLGSVSEYLARKCKAAVLVYPKVA